MLFEVVLSHENTRQMARKASDDLRSVIVDTILFKMEGGNVATGLLSERSDEGIKFQVMSLMTYG